MFEETQHSKKGEASARTGFMKGLVTGVVVIGLLGGVFFAGMKFSGGGSGNVALNDKEPTVPNPTAPNGAAAQPTAKVKAVSSDDHIRGSKDAQLMLIEYSDLECPFCKQFHPTMEKVFADYGNKVAWVYRHFPLSFHANAQKEAEASECVNELGGNDKFWKYIDTIYERTTANGTGFALDALAPLAKEVGVAEDKFTECLNSGKYAAVVLKQMTDGQAAGVNGTPGTFVVAKDGKQQYIPGALPIDQVKQIIDSML